ncbi:MAG: hypothetical protein HRT58_04915 [Crocinitomicaceae bacterium]|nr:hypothetical protein [Flavobacteriales bacterium]NQZ34980.1 hypothetical protein [Crocinitomicaceae bacterium]
MEITLIYTDSDGQSNFEVCPILMEEKSEIGFFSTPKTNVKSLRFQNVYPHQEWEFHSADSKAYITILEGTLELEVSNGKKKNFTVGDVIFLEDQSGQGHKLKTFEHAVCGMVVHFD